HLGAARAVDEPAATPRHERLGLRHAREAEHVDVEPLGLLLLASRHRKLHVVEPQPHDQPVCLARMMLSALPAWNHSICSGLNVWVHSKSTVDPSGLVMRHCTLWSG